MMNLIGGHCPIEIVSVMTMPGAGRPDLPTEILRLTELSGELLDLLTSPFPPGPHFQCNPDGSIPGCFFPLPLSASELWAGCGGVRPVML
jgi:hypothetical protein